MKYSNKETGPPARQSKCVSEPGGRIWLWMIAAMMLVGVQGAIAQIVNGDFESHCVFNPFTDVQYQAFQSPPTPPCATGSWFVSHGTPDLYTQGHGGNTTTYARLYSSGSNSMSGLSSEGLFVECPTFVMGHTYRLRVSFFTTASASNPVNDVFIRLATGLSHSNGSSFTIPTPTRSQVIQDLQNFTSGYSGGTSGAWSRLDFTFTPDTNYTQLWFFPFNTSLIPKDVFMDSVVVTEIPCPKNVVYTSFSGTPALTEANDYIQAYGTSAVSAGQIVIYRAGHYIHLGPDFHAAPGTGLFHAFIGPCGQERPIQSCRDNGGIADVGDDPTLKIGSRGTNDAGDNGWVRGLSPEGVRQEKLLMNYPNPFTGKTTIEYTVPEEGKVELVVLNMLGQKVAEVVSGVHRLPGQYRVEFDGSGLPPGAYYYTLRAGSYTATQKMVLAP